MRRVLKATLRLLLVVVLPVILAWVGTSALHRRTYARDVVASAPKGAGYGRLHVSIRLPGIFADLPEPLIVIGKPGAATMVYIRFYSHNTAKVGIWFWGLPPTESAIFPIGPLGARLDLVASFPALYPAAGSKDWGAISPQLQALLVRQFSLTVDGVARVKGTTDYRQPEHSEVHFGINPIEGGLVSDKYVDQILTVRQEDGP